MKIFISHADTDRIVSKKIGDILKSDGHIVYSDFSNVLPGASWATEITNAIESADVVIFLISKSSSQSIMFERELGVAISARYSKRQTKIIPILLDKHVDMPFFLRDIVSLDLSGCDSEEDFKNKIALLLSSLKMAEPAGAVETQLHMREAEIAAAQKQLHIEKIYYEESQRYKSRALFLSTVVSTFVALMAVVATILTVITDKQYVAIVALVCSTVGCGITIFAFYRHLNFENKGSGRSTLIDFMMHNIAKIIVRGVHDE